MAFEVRQCTHCQLRFPQQTGQAEFVICPVCDSPTRQVAVFSPSQTPAAPTRNSSLFGALLDNIRSTWNVGSMFRTADGAGLKHLYLCGYTSTPEHPKVAKTALGAEKALTWSHHSNAVDLAQTLIYEGKRLIALEGGERAIPIFNLLHAWGESPIVLVIGNEVAGVDPALLELCEQVVNIPMSGVKESLNAAVAFGIAAYILR